MISYEAAPGATVFIKGSDILKDGWQSEAVPVGRGRPQPGQTPVTVTAFQHDLPPALFPTGYNPFQLPSSMSEREWLDTRAVDMGPYFRRRGLVFVDGKPLEPVEQLRELASPELPGPPPPGAPKNMSGMPTRTRNGPIMQEIGGTRNGRFWLEDAGNVVHIRIPSGTPAEHTVEVTTREQAFAPLKKGLAYIRIKGLTFQHAGNGYPIPQRGILSTAGGNHWIIEGNTIEWANGTGLDIANGDWNAAPVPDAGLGQIIRGNTIRYCGVEGVAGLGTKDAVVEDNLIEWCGWADAERAWEAAGAADARAAGADDEAACANVSCAPPAWIRENARRSGSVRRARPRIRDAVIGAQHTPVTLPCGCLAELYAKRPGVCSKEPVIRKEPHHG
jgi:hypothetical protein